MPVSNYTVRVDEKLRKDATELFEKMGLTLPAAINAFLRQSVSEQRMPFMMGETDNVKGSQQIPDGIEWPRWDDGTLFDPREIGSRKLIDSGDERIAVHRLCYDGGLWMLLDDDTRQPVVFVDGNRYKTFPRALFEGWRNYGNREWKCEISIEQLTEVQRLSKELCDAVDVYDECVKTRTRPLDDSDILAMIIADREMIGTPERDALDKATEAFKGYLMGLSDDAVKSLEAILSLGDSDNLKDFSDARDHIWDFNDWKHEECAEGCMQFLVEDKGSLKAGLSKMTTSDWETIAE